MRDLMQGTLLPGTWSASTWGEFEDAANPQEHREETEHAGSQEADEETLEARTRHVPWEARQAPLIHFGPPCQTFSYAGHIYGSGNVAPSRRQESHGDSSMHHDYAVSSALEPEPASDALAETQAAGMQSPQKRQKF